MRDVRQAIESNSVELFLNQFLSDYYGPIQSEALSKKDTEKVREVPKWVRDAVDHMGFHLNFWPLDLSSFVFLCCDLELLLSRFFILSSHIHISNFNQTFIFSLKFLEWHVPYLQTVLPRDFHRKPKVQTRITETAQSRVPRKVSWISASIFRWIASSLCKLIRPEQPLISRFALIVWTRRATCVFHWWVAYVCESLAAAAQLTVLREANRRVVPFETNCPPPTYINIPDRPSNCHWNTKNGIVVADYIADFAVSQKIVRNQQIM